MRWLSLCVTWKQGIKEHMPSMSAGCIILARGHSRKALTKFIAVFCHFSAQAYTKYPASFDDRFRGISRWHAAMRKHQSQVMCPTIESNP